MGAGSLGGLAGNPVQAATSGVAAPLLTARLPGNTKISRMLGLAMRFTVRIGNLDLGEWQSCRGLKVDLKYEPVTSGGDYLTQHSLPDQVSYGPVVLERAMDAKGSLTVKNWLQKFLDSWRDGIGDDKQVALIRLLDGDGTEVRQWTLRGIRPRSWSGPDLSATDNKVAIERLELDHEGFLGTAPAITTIELAEKDAPQKKIKFRYNPKQLTINRSSGDSKFRSKSGNASQEFDSKDITTLTLSEMVLIGPQVGTDVQTLVRWATQLPTTKPTSAQQTDKTRELTRLTFQWGTGSGVLLPSGSYCTLTSVTVTLTRFDPRGLPIRAKVTLTLRQETAWTNGVAPGAGGAHAPAAAPAPAAPNAPAAPAAAAPAPAAAKAPVRPNTNLRTGTHRPGG